MQIDLSNARVDSQQDLGFSNPHKMLLDEQFENSQDLVAKNSNSGFGLSFGQKVTNNVNSNRM